MKWEWDWERIKRQLAREAREYMADLREIRDGLRQVEGWIALGVVTAAILIGITWAYLSLGFNPLNEHNGWFMRKLGVRVCQPVTNVQGVIIIIDLLLMMFMSVITLGNAIQIIMRVNRGQPREPRDLIISASIMLVAGIGGAIFMKVIC